MMKLATAFFLGAVAYHGFLLLLAEARKRLSQPESERDPDRGPDAKEPVHEQVTAVLRGPSGTRTTHT